MEIEDNNRRLEMAIKEMLSNINEEIVNLKAVREKNKKNAEGWLNNDGLRLLNGFKYEINQSKSLWFCKVDIEQFGQYTGNRFAKIHVFQTYIDRFRRQPEEKIINDIFIMIHHKDEREEDFTITLSNGSKELEPIKVKSSDINMPFLEEQLKLALDKFILEPLR